MTAETSIGQLSNNDGLHIWRFKPVDTIGGETFTLKLTSSAEPGVTVFISPMDTLAGGDAAHNGRSLGRDIAFTAYYRQTWPEFWQHLEAREVNIVGPSVLLMAVIGLFTTMVWWWRGLYVAFMGDSQGHPRK